MKTNTRRTVAVAILPLAILLAACGSDSNDSSSDTTAKATTTTAAMPDSSMADSSNMAAPEGPACSAVPADGDGSFAGMAEDPVATAASNNEALSTLVKAVTAADLVDTLNTGGPFTVFAPVNDAFAKIPADTLNSVLADPSGALTDILTYHVVPERIEPDQLGGTYKTVNGAELKVEGSAPDFTINGDASKVICSGIQTSNATVYLIDTVLMPPTK